jgi:hypothetical protein
VISRVESDELVYRFSDVNTSASSRVSGSGGSQVARSRTRRSALASGRALVALMMLCTACTTIEITTDYDPAADFSGLRTWAFADPGQPAGDPRLDSSLVRSRIFQALESELAVKGYGRAVGVQPDFLVDTHLALSRELDIQTFHQGYHRSSWGRSETLVREVDKGSLVLDFLDPKSRNLLWRGVAQARIDHRGTPAERTQRIREAVRLMLQDFPPPQP